MAASASSSVAARSGCGPMERRRSTWATAARCFTLPFVLMGLLTRATMPPAHQGTVKRLWSADEACHVVDLLAPTHRRLRREVLEPLVELVVAHAIRHAARNGRERVVLTGEGRMVLGRLAGEGRLDHRLDPRRLLRLRGVVAV